ncbi:MAG: hypothetical protein IPP29_13380 [Bacteroidetes bacterium]|nr:hypothetical protein [Bacteroidota bacterium]
MPAAIAMYFTARCKTKILNIAFNEGAAISILSSSKKHENIFTEISKPRLIITTLSKTNMAMIAPSDRVRLNNNNAAGIISITPQKTEYKCDDPIVLQYKISGDKYPNGV